MICFSMLIMDIRALDGAMAWIRVMEVESWLLLLIVLDLVRFLGLASIWM